MKRWQAVLCLVLLASCGRLEAQTAPVADSHVPVTVEYYYRIKWGSAGEFLRLYNKNHAPLLGEMKKLGFIRTVRVEEPVTHMAGGQRWDLRVTIVFRDATAAVSDPEWNKQWTASKERLYTDGKLFDSEEQTRFAMLEEHWDVLVADVKP